MNLASVCSPVRHLIVVPYLALLLFAATPALAQDTGWSGRLPYGGSLEQDGTPLSRTVEMSIELYASADGGSPLWTSALRQVEIYAGRFKIVLGEAPDTPIPATAFSREILYVQVQVDGVWLTQRQRVLAVPFAHRAALDAPIGSILAWHKSFANTPALPDGWAECNGQVVADPSSPYTGQALPDLNGGTRFLRGASSSGAMQSDQLQSHKHNDSGHGHSIMRPRWFNNESQDGDHMYNTTDGVAYSNTTNTSTGHAQIGDPVTSTGGSIRRGNETRPTNMAVVWIMKIR